MKFLTTPLAAEMTKDEAYTMLCLFERSSIAGVLQNVIPDVEAIYAKATKTEWLQYIKQLQDKKCLVYTDHTIILAESPYSYQNPNHVKAALTKLSELPKKILTNPTAMPFIAILIGKMASQCHTNAIKMPSVLHDIASRCHPDGMPIILTSTSTLTLTDTSTSSSSPLPPRGGSRGSAPAPREEGMGRKEEGGNSSKSGIPGGQAPQTPRKMDPNKVWEMAEGVFMTEPQQIKFRDEFGNDLLIDIPDEVSTWAKDKGIEVKDGYTMCRKFALKHIEKDTRRRAQ